jgi:hypothetical protein
MSENGDERECAHSARESITMENIPPADESKETRFQI